MRLIVFFSITAVGALVGLLSSANDDWATRAAMAGVGALFAAPLGAVLAGRRKSEQFESAWEESAAAKSPVSPASLVANYWRDKGHPPFMKPSDAEPDRRMFDPENLG